MATNETQKIQPKKYISVSEKNKKYDIRSPFDENLKINGKKTSLKIVEDENGFTYIFWKNKKYHVEIVEKNQNKFHILVNGISHYISVETPISYKRKKYLDKTSASAKTELITAPMPGKIVEVLVEENTKINQGDPILTLEAMKMQNEIISHVSGTVSKILVKSEDSVMKDDGLIEIAK